MISLSPLALTLRRITEQGTTRVTSRIRFFILSPFLKGFRCWAPPALEEMMIYLEEVENLSNRMQDEIIDRLRREIESRHRRKEDGPHTAV